jgi:hypothetical protein
MTVRDQLNYAARQVAEINGWQAVDGLDFSESTNPRCVLVWQSVVAVYKAITGDSPDLEADIADE